MKGYVKSVLLKLKFINEDILHFERYYDINIQNIEFGEIPHGSTRLKNKVNTQH
jgi:hypothetical protein